MKRLRTSMNRTQNRKLLRFESLEIRRLLAADGLNLAQDQFTVEQNSRYHVFDVLSNDTFDVDYAGEQRITTVSLGSSGGRIEVSEDGKSILYATSADFAGEESFTYFVDGGSSSRVNVSVQAPLRDDSFEFLPTESTYTLDVMKNDPFWDNYQGEKKITIVSASSFNAGVTISDDGQSLIYDRVEHRYGRDSIVYIVDDLYPANVSVDFDSPLENDGFELVEFDNAMSFDVIRNDPFWDNYQGDQKITHLLDIDAAVSASISADGKSIIFDPQTAEPGYYWIRYVVDSAYESTAGFQIHDPLRDDYIAIDRNSKAFAIDSLENDNYHSTVEERLIDHVHSVTSVIASQQGAKVSISDNRILYTPPVGFVGKDEFTYVADGKHEATVHIDVRDPFEDGSYRNDYPFVTKGTVENRLDVLVNDFVGSGYVGERLITSLASVDGADVSISSDGKHLLFTAIDDSIDRFQFQYTVDNQLEATVIVSSRGVSRHLSYEYTSPDTVTLPVVSELLLPRNYGGEAKITSVTQPENGATVAISSNSKSLIVDLAAGASSFEYTIDNKYTGTISTRYPNRLSSDHGVVYMNATEPVEISPLENDFASWTDEWHGRYDGPKQITAVSGTENGTVEIVDGATVRFTPNEDFAGRDTLTYTVDGFLESTIDVDVARLLRHDHVHVDPGSADAELNLLANDLVGGEYQGALKITAVTDGESGAAISVAADGKSVLYSPAANFTGTDRFDYTVDDQLKATVTVEVNNSVDDLYAKLGSMADFKALVVDSSDPELPEIHGIKFVDIDPDEALAPVESKREHSKTNVQVEGVDEADLIETDSDFIYTLTHGHVVITQTWPADAMEVVSSTKVKGSPIGHYLYEDRLTVISQGFEPVFDDEDEILFGELWRYPSQEETYVTVLDVSDRKNPKLVQRSEIEGSHVQTRRIDDYVYAVLRDNESLSIQREWICEDGAPNVCQYETEAEFNSRIENEFPSMVEDLLPNYESYGADGELVRLGLVIQPEDIFTPLSQNASSLVSVIAIDVSNNEPGLGTTSGVLTTGASELYVTAKNLYVFENHDLRNAASRGTQESQGIDDSASTRIMKFNLDSEPGGVKFAATGQVPGRMLDQFSADEYDGHLRVATTVSNSRSGNFSGSNENALFVLLDDNGVLEPVGSLQNLALNESIQSVRYYGNQALITTFQTIDPLFSIDLRDHSRPELVGFLTLPGFSSYMQFLSEDKVLTVGRNAANRAGGVTMISLFDVSNLEPELVDQFSWSNFSSSIAETDHHAFGWFPNHEILAIPSQSSYEERTDEDGDGYNEFQNFITDHRLNALDIDLDGAGSIALRGVIEMDSPLLRSAYIGDNLYAVAADSITSTEVASPNDVIAEVKIKPLEIEDAFDLVAVSPSPRLHRLQTVSEAVRDDLAMARDIGASEIVLVASEVNENRSRILVRTGDEHVIYTAFGDQIEPSRFDFQREDSSSLDWHNDANPMDTTGDALVTPRDVLVIVNAINNGIALELPTNTVKNQLGTPEADYQLDVNGDGFVTAIDALMVINQINNPIDSEAQVAAGEPKEPVRSIASDAFFATSLFEEDDDEEDDG